MHLVVDGFAIWMIFDTEHFLKSRVKKTFRPISVLGYFQKTDFRPVDGKLQMSIISAPHVIIIALHWNTNVYTHSLILESEIKTN